MSMIKLSLGATINIGGYNSARVEVTVEAPTLEEAQKEARRAFYKAAYDHVGELMEIKSVNPLNYIASKLDEEPN